MSQSNSTKPAQIYLAAPKQTYADPLYDEALAHIRAQFPGAEILSARDLFTDNRDWRDRWPGILSGLSRLIFITDSDGWVGRGVYDEVHDAASLAIPIEYLKRDGSTHPVASVQFVARGLRGWRQYALVLLRTPTRRRARSSR